MSRHMTAYELYLNEFSDVPMLSPEESEALILQAKRNLPEAINQIIISYQPLLRNFAKKMKWQDREEVMDFIQEGNMALLNIIQKFDHKRGVPFSAYAKKMVIYHLFKAYNRNFSLIKTPYYSGSKNHHNQVIVNLVDCFEENNTFTDENNGDYSQQNLNTDKHVFQRLKDPETYHLSKERREVVRAKLDEFSPRAKNILSLRYGFCNHREHTLEEIATLYDVSKSAIHQAIKKYLAKCLDLEKYFPNHKY